MAEVKKYPGAEADDYYWGVVSDFIAGAGSLIVGDVGAPNQDYSFGIRFTNVTIPKNAIIDSAHITLVSADDKDNEYWLEGGYPLTANIRLNDVDDAVAPINFAGAEALVLTDDAVSWSIPALDLDQVIDTPDISSLVQSIVNRAGWQSGNDMQVIFKTASGTGQRIFYYYGSGATKAELHIQYFTGTVLDFYSAAVSLSLSMEGKLFAPGGLNRTLPGLICEGSISVRSAALEGMLPGFLISASGGVGTSAALDQYLPAFLIESRSGYSADITLAGLLAQGAGLAGNVGSVGARSIVPLPGFFISASGKTSQVGLLIRDLPALEISAHGYAEILARLDKTLPGLRIEATCLAGNAGGADFALPRFSIIASAIHENRLSADLILPGFFIIAEGQTVPVLLTCIVMNPKNLAVSEYTGWNFNSLAFFNGKYLGASSSGIHVLDGDTDDGEPIISLIKTGHIPTESARARDIYLSGRSDAQMRVTLIGDEEEESREEADYLISKLGQDRIVTPRGMNPVYLQIAIENSQGGDFDLDSIQVFGEALKRRKR